MNQQDQSVHHPKSQQGWRRRYHLSIAALTLATMMTLTACSSIASPAGAGSPNGAHGATTASAAEPLALIAAVGAPDGLGATPAQQGGGNGAALGRAQQNVRLIQRYYEAYARSDREALRNEFFAPDIVWRIPGHHSLSGNHQGVDQVLAFFDQLASAGFRAEPITLAASDDWVIDLHRGWNTQGPARIDIVWALAFRIENGRIVEAINFPMDQHEADAFYLAQYPLKPLPDRLAP